MRPSDSSIVAARSLELAAADPVEPAVMLQVLEHRQFAVDARMLKDHAHLAANLDGVAGEVAAEHSCASGLKRNQRRKKAEQRGLAAAVGTEEAEYLAARDREADVARAPYARHMKNRGRRPPARSLGDFGAEGFA